MFRKWTWPVLGCLFLSGWWLMAAEPSEKELRDTARKAMTDGNFAEALKGFKTLCANPQADSKEVVADFQFALQAMRNLGQQSEYDGFREATATAQAKNWRALQVVADSYFSGESVGILINNEFQRGYQRRGGRFLNIHARDRQRGLQLYQQALPLLETEENKDAVGRFYLGLANALRSGTEGVSWRLQVLTDLATLMDYEDAALVSHGGAGGAPVDADGKPVFYSVPQSWAEAKSDGQRWRWALLMAQELSPGLTGQARLVYADFLRQELDVQTMAEYRWFFQRFDTGGDREAAQTWALHLLSDKESLARLATGIKRFPLPDEHNFITMYRELLGSADASISQQAHIRLAQLFTDRRQYTKAADVWKAMIAKHGGGDQAYQQTSLDQIVKPWGRLEGDPDQPAGTGAKLSYVFRNAKQVEFQAWEVKVPELLEDIKAYLKSNPKQLDWEKFDVSSIGQRLIYQNDRKYLGPVAASWKLDLQPRENHFDRRIDVTTPLQQSGAYLVTAKIDGGNVSRCVLWVSDTMIAHKPLNGKTWYFLADATTGQALPKVNVEFFGWRQQQTNRMTNNFFVQTKNFAEFSDANGQVMLSPAQMSPEFQWLVIARQPEQKRFAYLGFAGVWFPQHERQEYRETKSFLITDRPVYRPNQTVQFKAWMREVRYDAPEKSQFSGQSCTLVINRPDGEEVLRKDFTADDFGGIQGELALPKDAQLGSYSIRLEGANVPHGALAFRVEEYKKPEFEVTVEAPTEPVQLGEKITAKIKAKYYFGSPVTNAKVKYKILRTPHNEQWYPTARWDWLYGRGYWWYSYDYAWYPGFEKWGCYRPAPWWWQRPSAPPEVIAETEVPIGEDGTVSVEIDTATAKAMHGTQDHSYAITAEVTDESRRVIVGTGNVLVARQPFKVFAWVDRGYYRVGETITANFDVHTLSNQPVVGTGTLKLLSITYDDKGQPLEKLVEQWPLNTSEAGRAQQTIHAGIPGQYRLSYEVTDKAGHTQEGGYLFVVRGPNSTLRDFRFEHLELILDKPEYAPGEKIQLLINTERANSTVALFVRPINGSYLPPQIIKLDGKSTVVPIAVELRDMPNFFIEAVTISEGQLHQEAKDVVVPPEKRILNVEVLPSATEFLPGAKAQVQVKLTDLNGKPFVGTTVLTAYDKSVEYISGGSNVPEIKAHFWKWRRHHHPSTQTSFNHYFQLLMREGERGMDNLGVFGDAVADDAPGNRFQLGVEMSETRMDTRRFGRAMAKGLGGGMGGGGFGGAPGMPAPAAMAMDAMAESSPDADQSSGAAPAPDVQPTVRTNFADTAFWVGQAITNAEGIATVEFDMPESLTAWKIKTWALGHGTRVGEGESQVVTRKNILVRLQAPRFFVEKDEVVLSANVHNYLPQNKTVRVSLVSANDVLLPLAGLERTAAVPGWKLTQEVEIPASGEKRVDWRVKVADFGEAVVTMEALTDEESDAMQMKFPAYVHGMQKQEAFSGFIRFDEASGSIKINVPEQRRISDTWLEVRYSPTLAGAMIDALPYLLEYPYGCTEQTLNRFLPAVITHKILLGMNLDLADIQKKQTNLNAQELGDDKERAERWKRRNSDPVHTPVFSQEEMQKIVKEGVTRLTEMQVSDGGWGWFSGYGERSYPHTTAVVVHGLQIAQQNDVALVPGMLDRGIAWLKRYQAEEVQKIKNAPTETQPYKLHADNLDALIYMILGDAGAFHEEMREFLYRDRNHLTVYSKGLFGLALHKQGGHVEQLAMILQNIEQFVVEDNENQTAYLKLPEDNHWWNWYGNSIEANAVYLKLLAKTDPKGARAPRLVKYLLNNRSHGTYWNSTRDTALCIEALADYLVASGEDKPNLELEVVVDGEVKQTVTITAENLFTFNNKFRMEGDAISTGEHTIELRKKGNGPIYFNAYLSNFTLEDHITATGLEVKVNGKFWKLIREETSPEVAGDQGQVVTQRVEKYRKEALENLATLKSGDLVEIELLIDSKNDYEYLLFEDMKAAGFEPVEVRSGYASNSLGAYMELRDERVAFFMRQLPRGQHSLSYRMRAEIPGKFSALPTKAAGMYAPELKANADEIKLVIED